jgi:hypothetical protein
VQAAAEGYTHQPWAKYTISTKSFNFWSWIYAPCQTDQQLQHFSRVDKVELEWSGVAGAELNFLEWSGPKQACNPASRTI